MRRPANHRNEEVGQESRKKARMALAYRNAKNAACELDRYLGRTNRLDGERECLTEDELEKLCDTTRFEPISWERKKNVYNSSLLRMQLLLSEREICAVCDRAWPKSKIIRSKRRGKAAERWRAKLKGREDVPDALREYYDVSTWCPDLNGALLSPEGVERLCDGEPTGCIYVCETCYAAMRAGTKPPKFSIANGFDIGILPPQFVDLRDMEKRLTAMVSLAQSITVLQGGKHKRLKGHVSFLRMDPTPIANELPRLVGEEEDTCLVIMAGQLTPAQQLLVMRKHEVRVNMIRKLLEYYILNNELYKKAGISINERAMRKLGDGQNPFRMIIQEEGEEMEIERNESADKDCGEHDGDLKCSPDAVQDMQTLSIVANSKDRSSSMETSNEKNRTALSEETDEESIYIETSSIHVDCDPQTSVQALKEAERTVVVRNSRSFVSDYDKDILGLAFPDLFPFGRGHPGTERDVAVSFEECCRYYLQLGNRRFAQHRSFVMIVFDICARHRVISSTSIRSRWRHDEFEEIGEVTENELITALKEQRERRQDALMGKNTTENEKTSNRAGLLPKQVRVS